MTNIVLYGGNEKDPRVGGGVGGTSAVTKNPTQHSQRIWVLTQGSLSVGEYAAKFEELARYCPYFEMDTDGSSKCAKFEVSLRPELKMTFGHRRDCKFSYIGQ
ncbi:hypothetical protein Lal_00010942 [Lupinus albus]|nr:hypothetical protein Lal_00010942 [Lupinus albus]